MRITSRFLTYISILAILAGCAKAATEGVNVAANRYLEAWMSINYPDAIKSTLGAYTLTNEEGDGADIKEDGYAIVRFTASNLSGDITSYTDEIVAKQLGTYSRTTYYGPQVWMTKDGTIQAGLQEAIVGMKVGGKKKVVIPSWLMTYSTYSTPQQYFNKKSDNATTIYEISVEDYATDVNEWQIGRMKEYMAIHYGGYDTFDNDTTGFYYKRLSQKTGNEKEFKSDTTIYINYTGKLLNGLVFDTTVERVAKDNGLYNSSKTYEPIEVNWGEKYTDITLGSEASSVVSGFALTLWKMRDLGAEDIMDKGVGIFYSPLGYGYSGSGAGIPGYAPLVFEIEIVPEPED